MVSGQWSAQTDYRLLITDYLGVQSPACLSRGICAILFTLMSTGFPEGIRVDEHTTVICPRYSETDQAGVIHHSAYPIWFEIGRGELLRANGLAYRDLEKSGVYFVMVDLSIKFLRPARYDVPVRLETRWGRVTASRIEHTYRITEESTDKLLTEGRSVLACVDEQGKLRRVPPFMRLT